MAASSPLSMPQNVSAGFAALQRGDLAAARQAFDQAAGEGGNPAAWWGLSKVHRSLGQAVEEEAALDRALQIDAYYMPALLAKGDLFAERGDRRAANAYYRAGLKIGANLPSLAPEWRAELARVEALSRGFAHEYETHLHSALVAAGLGSSTSPRFTHALDLLLGKRAIYLQQPKFFYYPELPQVQFFDRALFPWVTELERELGAIRKEAAAILAADKDFVPYVQRESNRPTFNERGLLDNPDWGAFFLIKDGMTVEANAARCPRTFAAIAKLPLCRIEHRTPSVLFSLLRPAARIPPHHGFTNARLIAHLPLIVPPDCALRVGNETRGWREGEVLLFDDSIEHEAWNQSPEPRVVLIFDVWRPELSEEERTLIAATLAAVDSFGGERRRWTE